jgi:glycosyltransferase involved in cell wall biosynthesis
MKVAIVSSFDLEGGAARAAYRLHDALRTRGCDAQMFVQIKSSGSPSVHGASTGLPKLYGRLRAVLDHLPAKALGTRLGDFSVNWLPGDLVRQLRAFGPDVVHLHWISAGFFSLFDLASASWPIVWTAHDMWPFTGGCHYDQSCGRFASAGCTPCPLQTNWQFFQLARSRLAAKAKVANSTQITFISPSRWLAEVARQSPVSQSQQVVVIPNGIDLDVFKPIDRAAARDLFGLPHDKKLLLFGAVNSTSDLRKGYAQLDAALAHLSSAGKSSELALCVFGTSTRERGVLHGIPLFRVGHLADETSLVALYSAADLFVAPSLQDNLPNTVLEATACGLPTVAFAIGGMPDLISHGVTGLLAGSVQSQSLADAIGQALSSVDWLKSASIASRKRAVDLFGSHLYARAHMGLYNAMLNQKAVSP